MFDAACRELGAPDILVNDAGVGSGGASVAEMATEEFDRVIKTDLYGPFFCCRAFIRRRQAAGGGGKILNITSVHEAIPSPGSAAYGAAKGGLLTFTRSLALELAPLRINVNAVAPGLIRYSDDSEAYRGSGGDEKGTAEHPLEPAGRAVGDRPSGALPRLGRC